MTVFLKTFLTTECKDIPPQVFLYTTRRSSVLICLPKKKTIPLFFLLRNFFSFTYLLLLLYPIICFTFGGNLFILLHISYDTLNILTWIYNIKIVTIRDFTEKTKSARCLCDNSLKKKETSTSYFPLVSTLFFLISFFLSGKKIYI
jgi:hypothetical protein